MSVTRLSGKVFLLITGASQGIGRQIAQTFAKYLENGSYVLLLARNLNGLKETAEKLSTSLTIHYESIDLSIATAQELREIILKSLGKNDSSHFERAIVVHNAASIGDVTKSTVEMTDLNTWRKYCDLNVFSPAVLNGVFMKIFNEGTEVERLIINITSLCGIRAMKSTGYYCTGKAAREMFFKVFALENPQVDVLNYSPGPVETEMLQIIRKDIGDAEVRSLFNDMKKNNTVLTTIQTVERLIEVLQARKYKSGDHVDYYDETYLGNDDNSEH